jgi:TonB family protein
MNSVRLIQANGFRVAAIAILLLTQGDNTEAQQQTQSAAASPQTAAPRATLSYPNDVGGLKQLASDVLKAQQQTDFARAGQLLDSLVLPNFREWYSDNFTEPAAAKAIPAYAANAKNLPVQLAGVFLNAHQEGFHSIEAVRYEDEQSACSSSQIFSAMTFRRTRFPLYELRFTHGDKFKRVFAFAYVDGAFRLVLVPDFSTRRTPSADQAGDSSPQAAAVERIRMGGPVVAAQLVCKAHPYYPEEARRQYISGTVRLHAIIGKDGSVKQLELISGPEALVPSAKAAVSQWRYRPTMVNGEPVEVDTTIDVIYSLNY